MILDKSMITMFYLWCFMDENSFSCSLPLSLQYRTPSTLTNRVSCMENRKVGDDISDRLILYAKHLGERLSQVHTPDTRRLLYMIVFTFVFTVYSTVGVCPTYLKDYSSHHLHSSRRLYRQRYEYRSPEVTH